jgi:16S rRNA (cytosine1402-N4)-methyltransferase
MSQRLHIPVLLNEVLAALQPAPGRVVVDCTLGLGGHSAELLRRIQPGGHLIGIDFDARSIAIARLRLTAAGKQLRAAPLKRATGAKRPRAGKSAGMKDAPAGFTLVQNNFAALPTVLAECGHDRVDGILADLGVSSPQIDDPARGFSYRQKGPLDMRMDPSRGTPAAALLNRLSESQLAAAFLELGDETDAPQIARLIVERRAVKPIETTQELTAVVCQARRFTLERAAGAKLHPAARTFQALRILVNREMANLERLLVVAPACLNPGGVLAVISFHSGEDRRVKRAFREGVREGIYAAASPDVILATPEEVAANPRSRSAKLRWARRA